MAPALKPCPNAPRPALARAGAAVRRLSFLAKPIVWKTAIGLACVLTPAWLVWRGYGLVVAIVLGIAAFVALWPRLWPLFIALWLWR